MSLDGPNLELVHQYTRLIQIPQMNSNTGPELNKRELYCTWDFSDLILVSHMKIYLFNITILPVTLYACESWSIIVSEE